MNVLLVVSLPLALGFTLIRLGKVPVFAGFVTISSLIIAFSMIGAALALLVLLLGLPRLLVVISSSQLPGWAIWVLKKAYAQTGTCLYVSLVIFFLTDREVLAWRMFLIWGWSFLVIALIAFAAPALGVFSQLTAEQVDHLPKGAGRYAMRTFHEFRNAAEPVLSLGRVSGVITFPSFHTACALVLAQAWHGIRIIGPLAKILTGVIIFSCVPMGGHYLIDLAAGAAVWWGVTLGIDRLGRMHVTKGSNISLTTSPA